MTSIIFDGIDLSKIDYSNAPEKKNIAEYENYYALRNMIYLDPLETQTVLLTKGLMENGELRTLNEWIDFGLRTGWYLPNAPAFMQVLGRVWEYRDTDIGRKIMKEIQENSREGIILNTRISYVPQSQASILHYKGNADAYLHHATIKGGKITSRNKDTLNALFATDNHEFITEVLGTVFGKTPHIVTPPRNNSSLANVALEMRRNKLLIRLNEIIEIRKPAYGISVRL